MNIEWGPFVVTGWYEIVSTVEMVVIAIIATSWARASWTYATRFPLLRHGERKGCRIGPRWRRWLCTHLPDVEWRWRVAFWMASKAAFFCGISAILLFHDTDLSSMPLWIKVPAKAMQTLFGTAHTLAYLGWRQLPEAGDTPPPSVK